MFATLETKLERAYNKSLMYEDTIIFVDDTDKIQFGFFVNGSHLFRGTVIE